MKNQLLTAACAILLSVGVATAGAQIHIRIGPPPPQREVIPPPPREHRNWIWHPGYHRWEGDHYIWVAGSYFEPPRAHARWIPGHWDQTPAGWAWVNGSWQ